MSAMQLLCCISLLTYDVVYMLYIYWRPDSELQHDQIETPQVVAICKQDFL